MGQPASSCKCSNEACCTNGNDVGTLNVTNDAADDAVNDPPVQAEADEVVIETPAEGFRENTDGKSADVAMRSSRLEMDRKSTPAPSLDGRSEVRTVVSDHSLQSLGLFLFLNWFAEGFESSVENVFGPRLLCLLSPCCRCLPQLHRWIIGRPLLTIAIVEGCVAALALLSFVGTDAVFLSLGFVLALLFPVIDIGWGPCLERDIRHRGIRCGLGLILVVANVGVAVRCFTCTIESQKSLWKYHKRDHAFLRWLSTYIELVTAFVISGIFYSCMSNLTRERISAYVQSSLRYISMLWVGTLLDAAKSMQILCISSKVSWYGFQTGMGFSAAMAFVSCFWSYFLIMKRIHALETGMGERSNAIRRMRNFGLWAVLSGLCLMVLMRFSHPLYTKKANSNQDAIIFTVLSVVIVVPGTVFYGTAGMIAWAAFRSPMHRISKRLKTCIDQQVSNHASLSVGHYRFALHSLRGDARATVVTMCTTFLVVVVQVVWHFYQINVEDIGNFPTEENFPTTHYHLLLLKTVAKSFDAITNCVCVAVISGLATTPCRTKLLVDGTDARISESAEAGSQALEQDIWHLPQAVSQDFDEKERWNQKVQELATRAIRVRTLLDFYNGLAKISSWRPKQSTTNDVVRQIIIPNSTTHDGNGGAAWSTLHEPGPLLAQRMVTHTWNSCFNDLIAGVLADALEDTRYEHVSRLLASKRGRRLLVKLLEDKVALDRCYWICIFCVNEHSCICGGFGEEPSPNTSAHEEWDRKRRDTVTGEVFSTCKCREKKFFNDEPIQCEMNKFHHMMMYMSSKHAVRQVIAMDRKFDVFNRAWCVAELVVANICTMQQALVLYSELDLVALREMGSLDVSKCKATNPQDKKEILSAIRDIDVFNSHLRRLVFGRSGFISAWTNAEARNLGVGNIVSSALSYEDSKA